MTPVSRDSPARPGGSRVYAWAMASVVTLTDLLPPRIRYGYAHRVTRAMLAGNLPHVMASTPRRPSARSTASDTPSGDAITAALLADDLDIGGIGSVIEMLASTLGDAGVRPVVICPTEGVRTRRLRERAVDVRVANDSSSTAAALRDSGAAVAQLHSAPVALEDAALASGLPLVTAMHNTEIHFTRARWRAFARLMRHSVSGVAVSETVRAFHARRLDEDLRDRLLVIANGAPALHPATPEQRHEARGSVSEAVGADLGEDVLFVCLARYDSQKNIAGTAVGFLHAAAQDPHIRLLFAGDPSDWAELRRTQSLIELDPHGDRVHLLGNSDAVTLLTASDAFLLDSFFEGWPVAATEAAAAGLPLILSDMGGAVELVGRDAARSVLIANPSGDAAAVNDRRVRAARRRTRRQGNAAELEGAVLAVAARVRIDRADGAEVELSPETTDGVALMARLHADVLRRAADLGR